jgi:hypothetical protein
MRDGLSAINKITPQMEIEPVTYKTQSASQIHNALQPVTSQISSSPWLS